MIHIYIFVKYNILETKKGTMYKRINKYVWTKMNPVSLIILIACAHIWIINKSEIWVHILGLFGQVQIYLFNNQINNKHREIFNYSGLKLENYWILVDRVLERRKNRPRPVKSEDEEK